MNEFLDHQPRILRASWDLGPEPTFPLCGTETHFLTWGSGFSFKNGENNIDCFREEGRCWETLTLREKRFLGRKASHKINSVAIPEIKNTPNSNIIYYAWIHIYVNAQTWIVNTSARFTTAAASEKGGDGGKETDFVCNILL